jgi:hypothetical protein
VPWHLWKAELEASFPSERGLRKARPSRQRSQLLQRGKAPDELVEAIRKIASGARYVCPSLAESLASVVAGDSSIKPHEQLPDLEF